MNSDAARDGDATGARRTKMKTSIAATLLLIAGLAAAQTNNTNTPPAAPSTPAPEVQKLNQDIKADHQDIKADRTAIRADWEAQKAQMKDLNSQEKTAMEAVKNDTTKSMADKRTAIKAIHADFKGKKDALRQKMRSDRMAKRADIVKDHKDIHQDRVERREIKRGDK